jgi:hypothetical protein
MTAAAIHGEGVGNTSALNLSRSLWRVLAWGVLALALGLAMYRANTQTIAHDEALEYEWFLDGGVAHVLTYNPANHILFTLLAKPIVWSLGPRELIFRSPSLFGTVIYLFAIYLLCRRLFGQGVALFLSVTMLCLNPQILDFMPAARGYILGLAGLAVAMYFMARVAELGEFTPANSEWKWSCSLASISLALSVAANLTNIVPAACLALTFSAVAMGGLRPLLKIADNRLRQFARYFLLPGAAAGFCILWPFVIQWRLASTTIHLDKASVALRDIFNASFLYRWTDDVLNSLGAVPSATGSWQERVTDLGVYLLFPALFVLLGVGLFLARRPQAGRENTTKAQCRIFAGAAIASILFILSLHLATHVDYPNARYCLFLIPLCTVGAFLAGREIYLHVSSTFLKTIGLLVAAVVVTDYALSLQAKSFRYNAYDVISRDLFEVIANDARPRNLAEVRVGGTWWYEPEINYYRRRNKANWMKEYDIKDRSYWWQTPNSLAPADYDYFVFTPAGDPGLAGPGVRTIFRDDLRGITVVGISH